MHSLTRGWGVLFCVCVLGCGADAPPSKTEYFAKTQEQTMTPHGRILIENVVETADGKVQYKTNDGRTWNVDARQLQNGTYEYTSPKEVNSNPKQ